MQASYIAQCVKTN